MPNKIRHAAFVEAWMSQAARDLPAAQLVDLFDRAFAALWRTASATLGEITVWAIANRVVRTGRERYSWLSPLKVERGGISFKALREDSSPERAADGANALPFLVVELLTVLGNLTGEILTPELHSELARVSAGEEPGDSEDSQRHGGHEENSMEPPHGE